MNNKNTHTIPVSFYYVVIQNKWIKQNYPLGLKKFISEFKVKTYNKDISALSFMSEIYRNDFIKKILLNTNLKRYEHFAIGEESLYYGVERKNTIISKPIIDDVNWLKAYNLPEGNFIEFKTL